MESSHSWRTLAILLTFPRMPRLKQLPFDLFVSSLSFFVLLITYTHSRSWWAIQLWQPTSTPTTVKPSKIGEFELSAVPWRLVSLSIILVASQVQKARHVTQDGSWSSAQKLHAQSRAANEHRGVVSFKKKTDLILSVNLIVWPAHRLSFSHHFEIELYCLYPNQSIIFFFMIWW